MINHLFTVITKKQYLKKIKRCEYVFSNPAFKNASKNCKNLIRQLLKPKKQYRIKAIDALKHPFLHSHLTQVLL